MRSFDRLVRFLAYILELLILFTLQETPGLTPAIFGVRPVLVLPAVITIAMLEGEVAALAFGVAGGLLCDFGLSGVLGFHALILGLLCFFVSLIVQLYMQNNLLTALLMGFMAIGITVGLQWLFLYYFQYSDPGHAFTHHYLPKFFYTLLFTPLIYLLNRGLYQAVANPET